MVLRDDTVDTDKVRPNFHIDLVFKVKIDIRKDATLDIFLLQIEMDSFFERRFWP